MVRDLANAMVADQRIQSAVTNRVSDPKQASEINAAIEAVMMDVLEESISKRYGGQKMEVCVATPTRLPSFRRNRDNAIRAKFNGRNTKALSNEFKLSMRQIMRICGFR